MLCVQKLNFVAGVSRQGRTREPHGPVLLDQLAHTVDPFSVEGLERRRLILEELVHLYVGELSEDLLDVRLGHRFEAMKPVPSVIFLVLVICGRLRDFRRHDGVAKLGANVIADRSVEASLARVEQQYGQGLCFEQALKLVDGRTLTALLPPAPPDVALLRRDLLVTSDRLVRSGDEVPKTKDEARRDAWHAASLSQLRTPSERRGRVRWLPPDSDVRPSGQTSVS